MNMMEYFNEQVKLTNQCNLSKPDDTQRVYCLEKVDWYASGGVHGGLFALHLKHWLRYFDRDQFLLVPLTAYKKNPWQTLQTIATKLGIEPGNLAGDKVGQILNLNPQYNPNGGGKMEAEVTKKLYEFFTPFNEELREFVESTGIMRMNGGSGPGGLF
jgi:hypothetical protein